MTTKTITLRLVGDNSNLTGSLRNSAGDLERLGDTADQTGRRLERQAASARQWGDSLQSAARLAGGALAGVASVATARAVIGVADEYQRLENRLGLVTRSATELAAVQAQLNQIAARSRTEYTGVADLYIRLATVAGELGVSQQEILQFTEATGYAITQSGASAQSASGALGQLAQALGGGIVRAEEFNSILDGAPVILQTVARNLDGTGGSVAGLRKLVLDGKVESEVFFRAFLAGSGDLQRAAGSMEVTVDQAMTGLKNTTKAAIAEADMSPLVASIQELTKTLADPNVQKGLTTLAGGLVTVSDLVARGASAFGAAGVAIGESLAEAALNTDGASGDMQKSLLLAEDRVRQLQRAITDDAAWGLSTERLQGQLAQAQTRVEMLTGAVRELRAERVAEAVSGVFSSLANITGTGAQQAPLIFRDTADGFFRMAGEAPKAAKAVALTEEQLKAAKDAAREAAQEAARYAREQQSLLDRLLPLQAATRDYQKDLAMLNAAFPGGARGSAEYQQALAALNAELREAQGLRDVTAELEAQAGAIRDLMASFEPGNDAIRRFNQGLATLNAFGPASQQDVERYAALFAETLPGALDEAAVAYREFQGAKAVADALFASGGISAEQASQLVQNAANAYNAIVSGSQKAGEAIGENLTGAFDDLKDSLASLASPFSRAVTQIVTGFERIDKAREKNRDGTQKTAAQIGSAYAGAFGTIAAGAASFFDEQSKGYRTLMAVSQAFHAAELALTVAELVPKATAAILNQGNGDPYSAFGRMAAMAAIVAGLGVAVGSVGGGGGGRRIEGATGAGNVLGDREAESESIANSLEAMEGYAEIDLGYAQQQLASLRSIDSGISRLAARIAGFGPETILNVAGGQSLGSIRETGRVESSVIGAQGEALARWMERIGADSIAAFIRGAATQNISATLGEDLASIFDDIGQTLVRAVGRLGLDADAAQTMLENLPLGFDRINFAGLDGDEINRRLASVLAEFGDTAAELLIPGIDAFQQNGEDLLQTLLRVSGEASALDSLLTNIGRGFGDLAGIQLVELSQAIIEAAGGFDVLTENLSRYYDAFYSEAEQFANTQRQLSEGLAGLGRELPATREGFRALVDALDLTTEADRRAFGILTQLAGVADDYYDQLEDAENERLELLAQEADQLRQLAQAMQDFARASARTQLGIRGGNVNVFDQAAALRDLSGASDFAGRAQAGNALIAAINAEYEAQRAAIEQSARDRVTAINEGLRTEVAAINERLRAELDGINALARVQTDTFRAQRQAANDALRAWERAQQVAADLLGFVDSLNRSELAPGTPIEQVAESLRQFQVLADRARGGDVEAAGEVAGRGRELLDLAREVYGSATPFQDIFSQVVEASRGIAGRLGSVPPDVAAIQRVEQLEQEANRLLEQQLEQARQAAADQIAAIEAQAAAQVSAIEQQSAQALAALREQSVAAIRAVSDAVLSGNVRLDRLISAVAGGNAVQAAQLQQQLEAINRVASGVAAQAATISRIRTPAANDGGRDYTSAAKPLRLSPEASALSSAAAAAALVVQSITGSILPIPAFARGGIADGPSLFGEAGPEAAVPLPDGRTIPVTLRGAANGDTREVVAELQRLRQSIEQQEQVTVIRVVTPDGRTISEETLRTLRERSRRGETVIYADGVAGKRRA